MLLPVQHSFGHILVRALVTVAGRGTAGGDIPILAASDIGRRPWRARLLAVSIVIHHGLLGRTGLRSTVLAQLGTAGHGAGHRDGDPDQRSYAHQSSLVSASGAQETIGRNIRHGKASWRTDGRFSATGRLLAKIERAVDDKGEIDLAHSQRHLGGQLFAPLEATLRDRLPHRFLDFALCGDADLSDRYCRAMERLGLQVTIAGSYCAPAGMWHVARAAGLVRGAAEGASPVLPALLAGRALEVERCDRADRS